MIKRETMTSRERVAKAINHEPVDRMPIDFGGTITTGISAFAYWNLRVHLGLKTDNVEINDMMKLFLGYVDEDVRRRFHSDCIVINPGWRRKVRWNPRDRYSFIIPETAKPYLDNEGAWVVENGDKKMKMQQNSFFFDGTLPDLHSLSEDELIIKTAIEAEKIYKETDYYIIYEGFPGYFSVDPDWLCDLLLEPEKVKAENQIILDKAIEKAKKVIKHMGKYIQSIHIANDMGTQNGLWCSTSAIEDMVAPFYKKFCTYIHENSDLKVHLHCCGSIRPIIPILIDCGIDVLNPVQISAYNMDPEGLKKEFGKEITFWGGGCDTQNILGIETSENVVRNVKNLVGIFKPGYGYVFSQVHNIMGDVSPENIVAMLDTAYCESFY
jgi:uroporphyrinogen decarboxylase